MPSKLSYYADMATCVSCHKVYLVAQSRNSKLCASCKYDAVNWPMKYED